MAPSEVIASAHYAEVPVGGVETLLLLLRECGALFLGPANVPPRVPIDEALGAPDALRFARWITVAAETWSARLNTQPLLSIQIELTDEAFARDMLFRLAGLEKLDFAVAATKTSDADRVAEYRANATARMSGTAYRSNGPLALGRYTIIGARVADLIERRSIALLAASSGWRADGQLHISNPDAQLQRAFLESGCAAVVIANLEVRPGPRWVAPPEAPKPSSPTSEHANIITRLRATMDGDGAYVAEDIDATALIAPFAELTSVYGKEIELEGASLPYADLSGSHLDDVGLVSANLRGLVAMDVVWREVSLVEANLRWANFAGAQLPLSRLDDADCNGIDLTDARNVEGGDRANFDDATADRFNPGGPPSSFREATFRRARLRDADFTEVDLRQTNFDGADLTNAIFRSADLRGASFRGSALDGVVFEGANLEGAIIEGRKV